MKKVIAALLASAMLLSCMTACGSKDKKPKYDTTSRVLYSDEDTSSETESETESETKSETKSETETESDTSTDTSSDKKSDKDKKDSSSKATSSKTTSSKATSSKSTSSKATSSKSTSSKAVSSKATSSVTTSSKAASATSSKATSSATSSTNSDSDKNTDTSTNTDSATDTDSLTDTDSVTDTDSLTDTDTDSVTDTENTDSEQTDTDSEIEGSDPFDEMEDLIFTYGGAVITLGESINSVFDDFHEADDVSGAYLSSFGYTKTYYYNYEGFEIIAYTTDDDVTDDSIFKVCSIRMDTPGYSVGTEKNISVGDSVEDMLDIYGSSYEKFGDNYVFYSADKSRYLKFETDSETITEITISLI